MTAESLIEKAVEVKAVGGTHGGHRLPCQFLCLVLKMLQLAPDKEIVIEYIKNEDFKYVRLLGAFYMRLVGRPMEVYQYLEPLYNDYRKVRMQQSDGTFILTHVDELIDDMLRKDYLFDIALPRVPARSVLEKSNGLEKRLSVLDEEFQALVEVEEKAKAAKAAQEAAEKEAMEAKEREKWKEDPSVRRHEERVREKGRERVQGSYGDEEDGRRPSYRDRGEGRERERERDWDRRRRSRSRSRSRDRDERRRSRSPRGGRDHSYTHHGRSSRGDEGRRRADEGRQDKGRGGGNGMVPPSGTSLKKAVDPNDPEIIAANIERAKLGLKPLK